MLLVGWKVYYIWNVELELGSVVMLVELTLKGALGLPLMVDIGLVNCVLQSFGKAVRVKIEVRDCCDST